MIKYIHDAMAKKREALENNDKGFSLIELLVVVLILGILAAIAIPVFIGQQNEAQNSAAKANLANAKVAMVAYSVDPSHTLPTSHEDSTAGAGDGAQSVLADYGWPLGEPVVELTTASGVWCLSAEGASGTTWYVSETTNVNDSSC